MTTRLLGDTAYVVAFGAIGFAFVAAVLGVSRILQPHHPNTRKLATYESGKIPIGEAWVHFHIRYYIFAVLFLLFSIEAVFMYPWAVIFKSLGPYALVEMVLFIGVLLVGLLFAWRSGALKWV